jgi:hypothetical protein
VLTIQDNGQGIPMELDGKLDRGHGMASMKSRAKQMHGQCLVESGPGWGTVIRLTLPAVTIPTSSDCRFWAALSCSAFRREPPMNNILLLEDLPEIRAWLKALVKQVFANAQITSARACTMRWPWSTASASRWRCWTSACGRRLRGRRAHEHLLQPARAGREGHAAHALRGARGRADPVRLRLAGEREAFRQLIKISGVGPRTALAVLSGMSVADIGQAVTAQDASRFVKVPGIGKKTAERLLLELKGKIGADLGARRRPCASTTRRATSCRRWSRWATATRRRRPR